MAEEKEITLFYNGYEVTVNIKNDYTGAMSAIKEKLYLQDKDLEKFSLVYIDDDEDEVDVEEDQFDEAFNSSKWKFNKQEEEEDETAKGNNTPDISEIKEKIKSNTQKEVNQKIKKIKEDLINKFTKITNEKIALVQSQYEEKIKKLEETIKSLKEKNKQSMEEIEKRHEESVQNILNEVSKYAEERINNSIDIYNEEMTNVMNSQIQNDTTEFKNIEEKISKDFSKITTQQENMRESINDSKTNFSEIYRMSVQGMNNNK